MNIKNILRYFKSTIEDNNGEASIKRIMAGVAFIVLEFICLKTYPTHVEFIVATEVTLIGGLLGLTTWQNIQLPNKEDKQAD